MKGRTHLDGEAATVLRNAGLLVASGWCQSDSAKTAGGETRPRGDEPDAVQFCVGTAINRVATELHGEHPLCGGPIYKRAMAVFATLDLVEAATIVEDDALAAVVDFNDSRSTTRDMVVTRCREAARLLDGADQ